jgi:hypothetical protein
MHAMCYGWGVQQNVLVKAHLKEARLAQMQGELCSNFTLYIHCISKIARDWVLGFGFGLPCCNHIAKCSKREHSSALIAKQDI